MKAFAVIVALMGVADAYQAPSMAVNRGGGKAAAAPRRAARSAPARSAAPVKRSGGPTQSSESLPWTQTTLDGSLVGDVGFDPLGLAAYAPGAWFLGQPADGSLKWYREAELMHGRIAQLAALGWIYPELQHLPGNPKAGVAEDAFAQMNPWDALDSVPAAGWIQILLVMVGLEARRIGLIKKLGPNYIPGDLELGQGEGRWNPFGFNYTPEEYSEKQLQEIKHCRLAMLGWLGMALKSSSSPGMGLLTGVGLDFTKPEFAAKAGYFFPEGL